MAELRTEIHAHLAQHPGLTALEIGRALGLVPATVRQRESGGGNVIRLPSAAREVPGA